MLVLYNSWESGYIGIGTMTLLWKGGEGPRDIPHWAYLYMVTILKVDPDQLSQLKCVEQMGFYGDILVNFIRVFDAEQAKGTTEIRNFASLDHHPNLILYEGYMEKGSERVVIC
jgi:hypothetical protein